MKLNTNEKRQDETMDTKEDVELQKKKVYEKIGPILKLYDEGQLTKIEFVEKLAEAFYQLEEDEIIVQKMNEPDDAIKLHKTLENIFG